MLDISYPLEAGITVFKTLHIATISLINHRRTKATEIEVPAVCIRVSVCFKRQLTDSKNVPINSASENEVFHYIQLKFSTYKSSGTTCYYRPYVVLDNAEETHENIESDTRMQADLHNIDN